MASYTEQDIVYIDLIAKPLYTLGPQKRVGVLFQGCDIGCEGCIAKYTWKQSEDKKMSLQALIKKIKSANIKRLTISGGEPFFQYKALYELLKAIRDDFEDILVYSGYKYNYLNQKYPEVLDLIDVLIDGEFIQNQPTNTIYKGSKNQKMIIFNKYLTDLYTSYALKSKHNIQIYKTKDSLYLLGIFRQQDVDNIQKRS